VVDIMSVEFLKKIRKTERDCEEKIKHAEASKQNAVLEAEKDSVLKIRDAEIQAKEEADKVLSGVDGRVEKEFTSMNKEFEEKQNALKEQAKKIEKQAIDKILSEIL
jgi:vacuolar-type H+-ATPase subunit H